MANTQSFTVIGQFEDNISRSLSLIQSALQRQLNTQRNIGRIAQQIGSQYDSMSELYERTTNGNSRSGNMRDSITQASLASSNIAKLAKAVDGGIGKSINQMKAAAEKLGSIVQRSFGEAMKDQLSDIQAAAAAYGSLSSEGIIPSGNGGYRRAREIYKQLDAEIANVMRTSTAPSATITLFSRSLTDNLLPTLLKEAKGRGLSVENALGPVSQRLASFYEKAALLTPTNYSPQMVSKALQQALAGSSQAQLSQYDFFQLNPTVMNSMVGGGFFNATSLDQRLAILEKALENGLPQSAIDEMNRTISGGLQALEDTFWNPSVGILSFARGISGSPVLAQFKRQLQSSSSSSDQATRFRGTTQSIDNVSTPLEMVAISLGPLLQDLASFFSLAGPLMGHIALFYNQHFAPPIRVLTQVLKNLSSSTNFNLPWSLGRLFAETIKVITSSFKNIEINAQSIVDEFVKGFNSLGYSIDWNTLVSNVTTQLYQIFKSTLGKIFTAVIIWNIAWAVSGVLIQMFVQSMITLLISILKPVFLGLIGNLFTVVSQWLLPFFTTVIAPILPLVAVVTGVVFLIVRYRNQTLSSLNALGQILIGIGQVLRGSFLVVVGFISRPITWLMEMIMGGLRLLPFIGQSIDSSNDSNQMVSTGLSQINSGIQGISSGTSTIVKNTFSIASDIKDLISTGAIKISSVVIGAEQSTSKASAFSSASSSAASSGLELHASGSSLAGSTAKTTSAISGLSSALASGFMAIATGIGKLTIMTTSSFSTDSLSQLSGSLMQRAKQMFETLRSMGFSKFGAAALVGSMIQESGLNPSAVEPNGQGHGLLQWSFGRRDELKRRYGSAWNQLSNQLAFMMSELNREPALRALMNAGSRGEAYAAEKAYIRYGVAGARYSHADKIMQQDWFKYQGHLPSNQFPSLQHLVHSVSSTTHLLRSSSSDSSHSSSSFDYDAIDPDLLSSSQLHSLGRRVASGVVDFLDDSLLINPLFSF